MISAGRVLLMPKGAYNPSTTYEMLDIVSYNGSSYIAKGTTTGNLPTDTTYWQLSAYGGQAANVAGNFAELEISSVASMTHYADDIFVDENSQLMKATQTINIGDTIDVNTNCTPTTVEALITSLSDRVDSLDSTNRKLQGAIEIAAQTDLHSLALGEYYKSQTSFYVTNAPVGINQVPNAKFRLTVEAALDNASQASSPLLLTLRTPDGKTFTQGYDGTTWKSWEEIANENSVATKQNIIDNTLQTTSKAVPGAINELNSKNQTLTNEVDGSWYKGRNLFNPATVSEGYIRDSTGEFVATTNCAATDFIPVASGEKYVITSEQSGSKWGAWYNSSKQYISGFNGFDNLIAPSNAVYMRVTLNYANNNPNWATTTQIEQGDSATPYVPYAKTNQQLTQDTNAIEPMLNELGAKNLLATNLSDYKVLNTNGTWNNNIYSYNGVTFTVNDDGTITISGTATAGFNFSLKNDINISGNYILSGCPVGGSQVDNEGYNIQARVDGSWIAAKDSGDGLPITVNSIIDRALIHVANGTVMNNHVFKPMLRPASIADVTYVPYAMTNRELTHIKQTSIQLTNFNGTSNLMRCGNIVFFINTVDVMELASGRFVTIGTIPYGYRPIVTIDEGAFRGTDVYLGDLRIKVTTDGTVKAYNYGNAITAAANCIFNIAWVTSNSLPT